MMNALFALPSDLSISILQDWLSDIKFIVALDIAAARSVRKDYLGLVAHPSFVFAAPVTLLKTDTSTLEQVIWINNRMLKMSSLHSDLANLHHCTRISFYLLQHVRILTLSTIHNKKFPEKSPLDCASFHTLLKLLPALITIDMRDVRPSSCDYISTLASCGLPLKRLVLDPLINSCDKVNSLTVAVGNTIETLDLGSDRQVGAATLCALASNCHQLKHRSDCFSW